MSHRYPEFAKESERLKTFKTWLYSHKKPKELAAAGFFYSNVGDGVKCFSCGGGLKHWRRGDDAWIEHAEWFPNCQFVDKKKGKVFTEIVQERRPRLTTPPPPPSSDRLCKICYSKEFGVAYVPCGHLVACLECSVRIDECPVCRIKIQQRINIYF